MPPAVSSDQLFAINGNAIAAEVPVEIATPTLQPELHPTNTTITPMGLHYAAS